MLAALVGARAQDAGAQVPDQAAAGETEGAFAETATLAEAQRIVNAAAAVIEGAETAYVSDYISFSGRDGSGRVAFALDTNRGRAGDDYQAEHFVVMYDEQAGWVELEGYDDIPNEQGALLGFPESPYFTLSGGPFAPESIVSEVNGLQIELGELVPRTSLDDESTLFAMASGQAVLEWNGRRIEGRVIYEYLAMRDQNRLAAGLAGLVGLLGASPDFQGLYLASDDEDFYLHLALSSAASPLGDPLMAFWAREDTTLTIRNLSFIVTDVALAWGFYRWPAAWEMSWQSDCGDARLSVRSIAHQTQTNWVLGGFGMRAVVGELVCGDERRELFGLGELIR